MLEKGCDPHLVDPNLLRHDLGMAYRTLPDRVYQACGVKQIEKWLTQAWNFNHYKDEYHRYPTKAGWLTRSKSEALICDMVTDEGIPIIYDAVIQIGGQIVSPDFLLLSPLNYRLYYWEHLGLLDDPQYLESNAGKFIKYKDAGIHPGIQLITTLETENSPLDISAARHLVRMYFGEPSQDWLRIAETWATLAASTARARGELYTGK